MDKALRSRSKHDCTLPTGLLVGHVHSPYRTWLTNLYHDFKSKLLVSSNLQSSRYFRSKAAIRKEQKRHRRNQRYAYIVHPFSAFNRLKEPCTCTVWLLMLIFEAYYGTFLGSKFYSRSGKTVVPDALLLTLNSLLFLDFISRFFIGCPLEQIRKVDLEPKVIARRYLCTYGVFDVVPVVSLVVFYCVPMSPVVRLYLYQLHKLRLVRTKTFFNNMERFLWRFQVGNAYRTLIYFMCVVAIVLHEWTCIAGLFNLGNFMYDIPETRNWLHQYKRKFSAMVSHEELRFHEDLDADESLWLYFIHFAVVVSYFYGCVPQQHKMFGAKERVLFSLVLVSGLVLYVYAMAAVLQIVGMLNVSEAKYDEMIFGLDDYMTKKGFPGRLKKRIFKYYDYKYNKKFFSEQKISDSLSEHLRMEVLLFSCRHLIGQVKMFRGMSKSAVGCVLALLQQEVYLVDDVVLRTEDENEDSIYFILYGTCGIYLPSGKEVHHVEDGSHFGNTNSYAEGAEVHFLYSVVALEVAEVYQLRKKDLKYCCRAYPEIVFKLEAMVRTKAKNYNQLFALAEKEEEVTDEILAQLKRGKILQRGLKREDFEVV